MMRISLGFISWAGFRSRCGYAALAFTLFGDALCAELRSFSTCIFINDLSQSMKVPESLPLWLMYFDTINVKRILLLHIMTAMNRCITFSPVTAQWTVYREVRGALRCARSFAVRRANRCSSHPCSIVDWLHISWVDNVPVGRTSWNNKQHASNNDENCGWQLYDARLFESRQYWAWRYILDFEIILVIDSRNSMIWLKFHLNTYRRHFLW